MQKDILIQLLATDLRAGQIEKRCLAEGISLSVMGFSSFTVVDGELMYNHHFYNDEFSAPAAWSDIVVFDPENRGDFEYSQMITAEIIKALRKLVD